MAWFNSGRKKVREMVAAQATEVAQEKNARVAKKKAVKEALVPETSDDEDEQESESESEESEEDPPQEDMCAGFFKGCVSKKLVKAESFLSEVRVFTKGGAISMTNITNQEMLSSRAKQTSARELMRLKRDHQDVLQSGSLSCR